MPRGRATRGRGVQSGSVQAYQTWEAQNVTLFNCGPGDGDTVNINNEANYQGIDAWQDWRNDNPESETEHMHAFVEAQPVIDGQPLSITVNEDHPYRRQINDSTYQMMVGPQATHSVPFLIDPASVPTGDGLTYGANVLVLEQRGLGGF